MAQGGFFFLAKKISQTKVFGLSVLCVVFAFDQSSLWRAYVFYGFLSGYMLIQEQLVIYGIKTYIESKKTIEKTSPQVSGNFHEASFNTMTPIAFYENHS